MKIILSSKRHHYLARVIIFFLIVAGLIVCMTGCRTCFPKQYALIISSTEGGSVTDPGERTFTYDEGTVVDLVATPDSGYHFVEWTGDVGTIADFNAATTTITINDDYTITANFALEIWDWYGLYAIRYEMSGSYLLVNDLDSTTAGYEELASPTANGGKGWEPVATWPNNVFAGSFDGQGYEIRDLFIDRPDKNGVGLFNWVGQDGVIKDIGVVNVTVTGEDVVGGLVGLNDGTVSNSYAASSVTGEDRVGGLVGSTLDGTVSNCYSTGSVAGNCGVGGLVGNNDDTVSDSYSSANVTGDWQVGGLVGGNAGTVSNSYSTGSVTGNSNVGGLVGNNDDTVNNCHSTGSVTSIWEVGGLVGSNNGTVSNSYSAGNVAGDSWVGGLVGWNEGGIVSNSYSTASVTGEGHVGGLVGLNDHGQVSDSYSSGSVTGMVEFGGLVGWNDEGTVSNSFWDTETSGTGWSAGGTGKTTAQMQDIATFTDTETEGLDEPWDIIAVVNPGTRNPSYIWNIVDDETYPFLSWEP